MDINDQRKLRIGDLSASVFVEIELAHSALTRLSDVEFASRYLVPAVQKLKVLIDERCKQLADVSNG